MVQRAKKQSEKKPVLQQGKAGHRDERMIEQTLNPPPALPAAPVAQLPPPPLPPVCNTMGMTFIPSSSTIQVCASGPTGSCSLPLTIKEL